MTARQKGCGLIQGIRLSGAAEGTVSVHPKRSRPKSTYGLEAAESRETRETTGAEVFRNGYTFAPSRRSGAIWFYTMRTVFHQT